MLTNEIYKGGTDEPTLIEVIEIDTPVPVPFTVSKRQFAQILAEDGEIAWDAAEDWAARGIVPQPMIDIATMAINDEIELRRTLFVVASAGSFERNNPMIALFGWLMGKTNEQIDSWFIRGAALN